MKTGKIYCRTCKTCVEFSILEKVDQKIDMYHIECPKGHVEEKYIPKSLFETLKKYN